MSKKKKGQEKRVKSSVSKIRAERKKLLARVKRRQNPGSMYYWRDGRLYCDGKLVEGVPAVRKAVAPVQNNGRSGSPRSLFW